MKMNTDKPIQPSLTVPLLKVDSDRSLAAEGGDSIPDNVYLVFVVDRVTVGLNFPPPHPTPRDLVLFCRCHSTNAS